MREVQVKMSKSLGNVVSVDELESLVRCRACGLVWRTCGACCWGQNLS